MAPPALGLPTASMAPSPAVVPASMATSLAPAVSWAGINNATGSLVFATPAFVAHPQLTLQPPQLQPQPQALPPQLSSPSLPQQPPPQLQQQPQVVTRHQQTGQLKEEQQQQPAATPPPPPLLQGGPASPARLVTPSSVTTDIREAPARRTNCGVCQGTRVSWWLVTLTQIW